MNAFVIKSWSANEQPDGDGNYVNINGRAGLVACFLLWRTRMVLLLCGGNADLSRRPVSTCLTR